MSILYNRWPTVQKKKVQTSDRAVGWPRGNCCPPLVEQYIGRLLTHSIVRYWWNLTVIKAVPLTINGVLAVSCKHKATKKKKVYNFIFMFSYFLYFHITIVCSITCVVAAVHIPMMVAHSIQVIQIVIRVPSQAIWPSPWWPMGR